MKEKKEGKSSMGEKESEKGQGKREREKAEIVGRVEQLAGHVARRSARVAGGRVSEWPDISRGDQRIVRVFPPGLPPAEPGNPGSRNTTLAATDPPLADHSSLPATPFNAPAALATTAYSCSSAADPLGRTPTTAADAVHVSRLTVIFISAPHRRRLAV